MDNEFGYRLVVSLSHCGEFDHQLRASDVSRELVLLEESLEVLVGIGAGRISKDSLFFHVPLLQRGACESARSEYALILLAPIRQWFHLEDHGDLFVEGVESTLALTRIHFRFIFCILIRKMSN